MIHRAKQELKGHDMQRVFTKKSPHPLMWATGIAIILFCAAGLAAVMGWIPTSNGSPSGHTKITNTPEKSITKKSYKAPIQTSNKAYIKPICNECGVIESTRQIDVQGAGMGIGAVGGAVIGGVLGHQVGDGRGKDAATVAGAVGGAVAGNEIEKRAKGMTSYEVTVRFDNGSTRVFNQTTSTWRNGDHVRVVDGIISPNG
jgi:outer membrane lipoprotein SlyB